MSIFKPNSVDSLRSESTNVLSIFTKSLEKLDSINDRISKVKAEKLAKIAKEEQELTILELQQKDNKAIVKNINNILNR